MPVYEWRCLNPDCKSPQGEQTNYEYFHINSQDVQRCPKCGSKDAEKLVSRGTSFDLKGGGWYQPGPPGKRKR